ncbi:hypothetical protein A3Q56_00658 [Intoshia linei]|uniref:Uncharacterized protein n=1 Tax=Intoshia linei TaxID=1819745 RepID=A0A177BBH1_9BILA|nr:hypothetical protein A3Q56_00658 [Intoshia linei]
MFYQIVINLVENDGKVTDEFPAYDETDYSDDEFIDSLIPPIEEDTNHKDNIDYSTCSEIDIEDDIISRMEALECIDKLGKLFISDNLNGLIALQAVKETILKKRYKTICDFYKKIN